MSVRTEVNPGRFARVTAPGVRIEVERESPVVVVLRTNLPVLGMGERTAEALLRGLADVLGYEIGPRHEC